MFKTFNINSDVKVKLTPEGRDIYYENENYKKSVGHYPVLKEDEKGYSTWQLWVLIETFGPHISMVTNLFETNILINDEDLDLSNKKV